MVHTASNWRVLKEDLVFKKDGVETVIPAGHVVAYQTKNHLLTGVAGVTMHHPVSMGIGGTGKRQPFTGYHFKASRARLTPLGISVSTVGDDGAKDTVWLMAASVYCENQVVRGNTVRVPIHKTLDEAYRLISLD